MITLGVVFLGRKRPGFDPEWGKQMEQAVRAFLSTTKYEVLIGEQPVSDDAALLGTISRFKAADVDVLLVLQPTMSDGRFAPTICQLWQDPVLLWATPEKQDYSMISSCSLVGLHAYASTMRQLKQPFEIVYGMPGEKEPTMQLDRAVRLAYASTRLRRGRVGIIGYHAPGFIDMHADPFLMSERLGMQLWHTGIQDLVDRMNDICPDRLLTDVEQVLEMGVPFEDLDKSDLPVASRYYLAMSDIIREERLDVLAVREWPELPNLVGQWPYLAMVRLLSEEVSVACEGDTDGGISCLIGNLLGFGAGYLSDWLEHDHETVTLWHAGNGSLDLCDPVGTPNGPRLARHFNNRKPLVVNAEMKSDQPLTIFRLWHCDNEYMVTSRDAVSVPPKRKLLGTNGLVKVDGIDVMQWFEALCHAGMPHHVAVFPGHHTNTLRRFAIQTDMKWIQ